MPRTFKATIALIVTLVVLAVLTIFNVVQTDNAEEHIVDLRQKLETLGDTNAQILQKLDEGVAVNGRANAAGSAGKYAEALNDPDNILEAPSKPLIPSDAIRGGTLKRYLGDTPKGYNWLTENGADVQELMAYAHNQFARRDPNNPDKWIPELAYKISVNDDYTEYVVHLREDVQWQVPSVGLEGKRYDWVRKPHELTAEDAVFAFKMIKNDQVQAGALKNYFKDMKRAEVVDKYTFKVVWKRKVQQSLASTIASVPLPKWLYSRNKDGDKYPKETLGKKFNTHWASRSPIGTGPYKITHIETDKRIVLERNPNYWGPKPPIETIEYQIIKDPQTAYTRLKGGDLDFSTVPPPVYKSDILDAGADSPFKNGNLKHTEVLAPAYYYLGWNADKPLFADRRVRRAMTHALDRTGIINNVLHGLGRPLTGSFLPDHPANNPAVDMYKYDLDKAGDLLDAAGWTDSNGDGVRDKMIDGARKDFRFTMLAYNKPTPRKYLAIYKEALRKIGVIMKPSFVDWSLMQKKMNGRNFDAYTGGWALGWSVDPYQIWHSSQADKPKGSNRVGFRNDRADQIIEKLRETFDNDKRIELLQEFHMILHKEQPYTFFYQLKQSFAWQPRVKNVTFGQLRPIDLSMPWYIDPAQSTK